MGRNNEERFVPLPGTPFLVDTQEAVYVENEYNSSYTLMLLDPSDTSRMLNLVLEPMDEGYTGKILEYNLNGEERTDLLLGKEVDFQGKIGYVGEVGDYKENGFIEPCVHVYYEEHPCTAGGNHAYGEPCNARNEDDFAQPSTLILDFSGCGGGGSAPGDGGHANDGGGSPNEGIPTGPGGDHSGGGSGPGGSGGAEPDGFPTIPVDSNLYLFENYMNNIVLWEYFKNRMDTTVKDQILQYLADHGFSEESMGVATRYIQLDKNISENANYLMDNFSDATGNYDDWKTLFQYHPPSAVTNKIAALKVNNNEDWDLQLIGNAEGANVNMDYFSINITQFPKKPFSLIPNERYSPEEFLNYVRKHINDFTSPNAIFEPSEVTGYPEYEIWNNYDNPLTAILHIDIPLNNGSVICSKYDSKEWYFTTLTTPFLSGDHYDGTHPVSGNRAFGIKENPDGSYTLYTRGVDRVRYRWIEIIGDNMPTWDSAFQKADQLWGNFQNQLVNFIMNFDGNAEKIDKDAIRVDFEGVKNYIEGN